MCKSRGIALKAGVAAMMLAGSALAAPGDIAVRAGAAHVSPNDDSGGLSVDPTAEVGLDAATSLGISLTYMATDHLGVGVLGAWPFRHDIKGAGSLAGAGKVGETKHLPPTVTLQYHFAPEATVRPFVGAGFNYTTFFSEKGVGALDGVSLSLDDSYGWALEAGVDFDVAPNWFLSGQVFYIAIDTTVDLGDPVNGQIDLDIDPWVFMLSGGRRF